MSYDQDFPRVPADPSQLLVSLDVCVSLAVAKGLQLHGFLDIVIGAAECIHEQSNAQLMPSLSAKHQSCRNIIRILTVTLYLAFQFN